MEITSALILQKFSRMNGHRHQVLAGRTGVHPPLALSRQVTIKSGALSGPSRPFAWIDGMNPGEVPFGLGATVITNRIVALARLSSSSSTGNHTSYNYLTRPRGLHTIYQRSSPGIDPSFSSFQHLRRSASCSRHHTAHSAVD